MEKTDSGCVCKDTCKFYSYQSEKAPEQCPGIIHSEVLEKAKNICATEGTDARKLWQAFGRLIGTGGAQKSRVEHIVDFSRSLGVKRLGIGSCLRYIKDARFLQRLFQEEGFQCTIIFCKVGGWQTKDIDVNKKTNWIICNPIGQALILNKLGCEVEITLGLCMGHEMIFNKYAEGYVTNLYVKEKISHERPRDTVVRMMKGEYRCDFHKFE